MKIYNTKFSCFLILLFVAILFLSGCGDYSPIDDGEDYTDAEYTSYISETDEIEGVTSEEEKNETTLNEKEQTTEDKKEDYIPKLSAPEKFSLSIIPSYSGKAYIEVNNNIPYFSSNDYTTTAFEYYSSLDSLGRCGVTYACIGKEIMPTTDRESIGMVKPTGWQTVKYDCVDGKYLYNRCHLIGYQLSGESANNRNLITGTRAMNVDGMLPFENMVADYIKETENHVMYRVTPIFEGENLLATGVLLEAYSVEDKGEGILFNVFCYNSQPDIKIDYSNGNSELIKPAETEPPQTQPPQTEPPVVNQKTYIVNINPSSKKIHETYCSSVKRMKETNKWVYTGTLQDLINKGYDPCKNCNPR